VRKIIFTGSGQIGEKKTERKKPNLRKKTELTPKKPNLRQKNRTYAKKTELTPKKPKLCQKKPNIQKNRTYAKKTEVMPKKTEHTKKPNISVLKITINCFFN